MANPVFYVGALDELTFTASGGAATGYPVDHLYNYIPTDLWRSGSSAAHQTLRLDRGAALAADYCILHSHNYDNMEVYLQYDTNDNAAFPDPVNMGANFIDTSSDPILINFTSINKRYWRLYFATTGAPPELGQFFVNKAFNFGVPFDFGYTAKDEEYKTETFIALDGTMRTSQSYKGRLLHTMKFSLVSDTVLANFQRFFQKIRGRLCPFYYADPDSDLWYVHLDADVVPIEVSRYGSNNIGNIKLLTQAVNQNPLT